MISGIWHEVRSQLTTRMEKIYADCVWLLMTFEFHKLEPYLLRNTKTGLSAE